MFRMKRLAVFPIALMAAISANALEITGAVYGKDGNAVAGAPVSAYVPTTETKLAVGTTDQDGAFVLKDLPEGVVEIRTSGRELYALAGDDLTINIWANDGGEEKPPDAPHGDRSVRGIVRLDGKPLANAPVWFHPNGNELVTPVYAVSNAQGEFRRDGLAPQPWIVSIAPSLEPRVRKVLPPGEEHPLVVDLTKAREGTSTIELVSGPFIRGRVVDADGKPVARTRVQLIETISSPLDVFLDSTPRTDAAGRFAFPAPEWPADTEVCVVVIGPQQSPVRSKAFAIGANGQSVDITLPRFDDVRVRIMERSGKPVRKARLAFLSASETKGAVALPEKAIPVSDSGELTLRLVAGPYDFYAAAEDFQARRWNVQSAPKIDVILEREALVRGRVHRGDDDIAGVEITVDESAQKVVTSDDGTFEIKGLGPGKHQLDLSKYDEWLSRRMEVDAPGNVDVALPMMGTLRVHIVDADSGAPMGDLAFNIESNVESNGGGASMQGFATPQEGTFDMDVPVGSYQVQFAAEEYRPSPAREFRIEKGRVTAIEARLARGITVTGRVADESGNGVADAFIGVSREKEDLPLQGITDEDGTFAVKAVERGTPAVLSVRKNGYLPFQKSIETQSALVLDVRLSRGLGLQGIVLLEGKPAYGATVRADTSAAGMSQAETTTDEDGRFALTGLADARYTVSATMTEGRTVLENVEPASRKEIVLALNPTPRGVIYGTVRGIPHDLPGNIVHRTVVAYTPNDGAEATIDESGNYRMENTPTGLVRLWARIDSSAESYRLSTEKHVDVPGGGELRVDLQFGGEVHVTGRVTYDHKPVADASVLFAGPDDSTMTAGTKGDGMYDVMLPVEGTYEITVSAHQIPTFLVRREVRGGARLDLDLQQMTIEGLVIDAATRQPIANARIAFGDEDHVFAGVDTRTTDAGGRFRRDVQELWHVYATATGYAPKAAAAQSGQPLVLALDPAAELHVRVTDARSGAPLQMRFDLEDDRGAFVYADPDRSVDGTTYRFSLSPSAKYTLTITADGYETKILQVTAPGNLNVTMQ